MATNKKQRFHPLRHHVLRTSQADTWNQAKKEWVCWNYREFQPLSGINNTCICGRETLKHLYYLKNTKTGMILGPISFSCMKEFYDPKMLEWARFLTSLKKLQTSLQHNIRIACFATNGYSVKILTFLERGGYFKKTRYNHYNGFNDYLFLKEMFFKKDKSQIRSNQYRRMFALNQQVILPGITEFFKGLDIAMEEGKP